MNFLTTVKNSLLEGFYPAGWDMAKIDACCDGPVTLTLDSRVLRRARTP